MKTVNYSTVVVSFKVTKFFEARREANVTVSFISTDGEVISEKSLRKVKVSALLGWRLTHNDASGTKFIELNKIYTSSNNEKFRKTNPLQLVQYAVEGNLEYKLACVEERSPKVTKHSSPFGGADMLEFKTRYHYAEHYRRFRIAYSARVLKQKSKEAVTA